MTKNNIFIIVSFIFLTIVLTVFITLFITNKYFLPKIKTVSIMQILNDEDSNYKSFLEGKINQEEYQKTVEKKMQKIQEALEFYTSGSKDILLVEEAVIKTKNNNYISITEEVKNYVK